MHLKDSEELTKIPNGQDAEAQPCWRKDFPIDVALDEYVSRRDFTKFLVLISLAFTTGQFWIALRSLRKGKERGEPLARIAGIGELPVGQPHFFSYPSPHDRCVLVRTTESDYVAYSQRCTHLSCAVMPDMEKGELHCPCHNGCFDMASGRATAGPPRRPLPRIKLRVEGDNVYAVGVEAGEL